MISTSNRSNPMPEKDRQSHQTSRRTSMLNLGWLVTPIVAGLIHQEFNHHQSFGDGPVQSVVGYYFTNLSAGVWADGFPPGSKLELAGCSYFFWMLQVFGPFLAKRTTTGPAKENVPANSSAEQELVASPYGQLLTETWQPWDWWRHPNLIILTKSVHRI